MTLWLLVPFMVLLYWASTIHLLNLEPETSHAVAVSIYHPFAVFLRIVRSTEQHAVVSSCFLVLAYTAGFDLFIRVGGWFEIAREVVWRCRFRFCE